MVEFELILLVVFAFSIVQSVFGVGLLIFGTPTCLMLGVSFDVALAYLLPASMSISCIQIYHGRYDIRLKKEFLLFTVPFVILGLMIVLIQPLALDMKFIVGSMLLITGGIRLYPRFQHTMAAFIKKQMKLYLITMGFIHGLSNMGGGFLTILSSSLFKEKKEIRANIAYGYLIFATAQIMVLAIISPRLFDLSITVPSVISICTYLLLGNAIFLKSKEIVYQKLITILILVYGIVMLLPVG